MSEIIKVENLSKKFVISHEEKERYTALRDVINRKAKSLLTFGKNNSTTITKEDFWALKDLNFSINAGERVGIIGRNGAGKSTLLKVLSRITEPSKGRITIKGRVASLLEVGTGFHPELSGRENIFLNGAILGMSRAEIKSKFDEIVDFAEIEKFLDTPVKRYSSGMYVRLAFSVAAHLEPEILIIDEVLAVGDAQFQKKCLGKMEDVSNKDGRTIIFVSHHMPTIKSLCSSIIYMKQGQIEKIGDVEDTIKSYLDENRAAARTGAVPREYPRKYTTGTVFVDRLFVADSNNEPLRELHYGEKLKLQLELDVTKPVDDVIINILISTITGDQVVFAGNCNNGVYEVRSFTAGKHVIEINLDAKLLPLNYSLSAILAYAANGTPLEWIENVYSFNVSGIGIEKGTDYPWGLVHGYIEPASKWSYHALENN